MTQSIKIAILCILAHANSIHTMVPVLMGFMRSLNFFSPEPHKTVNAQVLDPNPFYPLIRAIKEKDLPSLETILKSDPRKISGTYYYSMPLILAVKTGNLDVVKMILNYQKPFEKTDMSGALETAIRKDNGPLVSLLLDNGASVNCQFSTESRPLPFAFFGNKPHSIAALLPYGPDINCGIYCAFDHPGYKNVIVPFVDYALQNGAVLELKEAAKKSIIKTMAYDPHNPNCLTKDELASERDKMVNGASAHIDTLVVERLLEKKTVSGLFMRELAGAGSIKDPGIFDDQNITNLLCSFHYEPVYEVPVQDGSDSD